MSIIDILAVTGTGIGVGIGICSIGIIVGFHCWNCLSDYRDCRKPNEDDVELDVHDQQVADVCVLADEDEGARAERADEHKRLLGTPGSPIHSANNSQRETNPEVSTSVVAADQAAVM